MNNMGAPANNGLVTASGHPSDGGATNAPPETRNPALDVSRNAAGQWLARFEQLPPPVRSYALPLVATVLVGAGGGVFEADFYLPGNPHRFMHAYPGLGLV